MIGIISQPSRWLSSSNVFNPSSASLLQYPPGQLVDWFLHSLPLCSRGRESVSAH
jgi:hypothetical protein